MSFRGVVKGVFKLLLAVVIVIALSAVVAVTTVETQCRPLVAAQVAEREPLVSDADYARTEANTYWTFPEWYIVYSYEDLGAFLEGGSPSAFPWFNQIAEYWQALCRVNQEAAALPGDHGEYKRMVYVIGLSYTFEFGIKGLYEVTIGRVSEWLRGAAPAASDTFEQEVAQAYGAFLNQVPWYEFPFMEKLAALWRDVPLIGDSAVRNVERHVALSAEYLAKAGYAQVISAALAATADPADRKIRFVASPDVLDNLAGEPDVEVVRVLEDGDVLLSAPRYRVFTNLLKRLAASGVDIREIAGNRSILMTAIRPDERLPPVVGSDELFSFALDGRPGFRRHGYRVDVTRLSSVLRAYESAGVTVEHLYDY